MSKHKCPRVGLKSLELWAIIGFLMMVGFGGGWLARDAVIDTQQEQAK
ncbi:hypothetical protein SKUL_31 [Pseudomonas phage Skulduggery]|uniref:Uncharacterized protein n=1 Tax=Pseudomonas phage Skulduggery TaxID=2006671 RepID=A0A1Y0SUS1_9CAUD|nr:hypothetical protein PP627_gp31 [Pseudomonas phage Skulduggery]ARV77130.1 hypothetical protein SKUL_31 [Pseudomonas phage Skulduggery]